MNCFKGMYKDKTVLVTGHTGFKGSWLASWLTHLGANVVGLSLDVPTSPSNFQVSKVYGDISDHRFNILDSDAVRELIADCEPDFIFHLAAQALVVPSYENPLDTILINSIGTANVLDALRVLNKNVTAVMITSDKAYDNLEWVWGYRETDRLGGKDPYSASKAMAELVIRTFTESYFNLAGSNVRLGVARAGNVIGGGDWAKNRIVPDCMTAWSYDKIVDIRSPRATRPWQHVLEPLSGYLALGEALHNSHMLHDNAYNFGPSAEQNHSVSQLIDEMRGSWEKVRWNDISTNKDHFHEAGLLKLNCDKALFDLGWLPTLEFKETVRMTVEWYRAYYEDTSQNMKSFTINQIDEYTALAVKRSIQWTN